MAAPPTLATHLLIVDDEPELLEILGDWFDAAGYDVRTAADGFEALMQLREQPADVVITDLKMPGMTGLHLLSVLKDLEPSTEVIFLTGEGTMEDAIVALREGRAFDFIPKPLKNLRQLQMAVERALLRKETSDAPAGPAESAARPATPQGAIARSEPLTPRELEIVGLLVLGLENRVIGERLGLSEKTIKNNFSRLFDKLKVKNRTQAILACQQQGLV